MKDECVIKVEKLLKRYGAKIIVNRISFEV